MDVAQRILIRYGLHQLYNHLSGGGRVDEGVIDAAIQDVRAGRRGGVADVDIDELSRNVDEFLVSANGGDGNGADVGGGSPGSAPGGRAKSSAHLRSAWRFLAMELTTHRRNVQGDIERTRRVAAKYKNFATRVARAGYWRSVGAVKRPEQAARLDTSWTIRDLLPNWLQRFGLEASQRILAGRVSAAFLALSPDEEAASDVRYHSSAWDSFVSWLGGGHRRRHRASNRWTKRMALLRKLREQLIFGAEGIRRVRSPVNDAWCSIQARKLVSELVEREEIDARHARWYRDALVTVFYLEDDDDKFFSALGDTSAGRIY